MSVCESCRRECVPCEWHGTKLSVPNTELFWTDWTFIGVNYSWPANAIRVWPSARECRSWNKREPRWRHTLPKYIFTLVFVQLVGSDSARTCTGLKPCPVHGYNVYHVIVCGSARYMYRHELHLAVHQSNSCNETLDVVFVERNHSCFSFHKSEYCDWKFGRLLWTILLKCNSTYCIQFGCPLFSY